MTNPVTSEDFLMEADGCFVQTNDSDAWGDLTSSLKSIVRPKLESYLAGTPDDSRPVERIRVTAIRNTLKALAEDPPVEDLVEYSDREYVGVGTDIEEVFDRADSDIIRQCEFDPEEFDHPGDAEFASAEHIVDEMFVRYWAEDIQSGVDWLDEALASLKK